MDVTIVFEEFDLELFRKEKQQLEKLIDVLELPNDSLLRGLSYMLDEIEEQFQVLP